MSKEKIKGYLVEQVFESEVFGFIQQIELDQNDTTVHLVTSEEMIVLAITHSASENKNFLIYPSDTGDNKDPNLNSARFSFTPYENIDDAVRLAIMIMRSIQMKKHNDLSKPDSETSFKILYLFTTNTGEVMLIDTDGIKHTITPEIETILNKEPALIVNIPKI